VDGSGVAAVTDPLPAVDALIPHRPPALALDEVVSFGEGLARCTATLRGTPYGEGGRVRAAALLEHMAQAVAVYEALDARARGAPPRAGAPLLVGVGMLAVSVPALRVGDRVVVEAERVYGGGDLARFVSRVRAVEGPGGSSPGAVVAEGHLTVYRGEPRRRGVAGKTE